MFSTGILEWITLLHLVCMDLIIYFKNFNPLTVNIYFLIITFILSTCLNYVINRSSLFSVVTKLSHYDVIHKWNFIFYSFHNANYCDFLRCVFSLLFSQATKRVNFRPILHLVQNLKKAPHLFLKLT